MKILVCGSRSWQSSDRVWEVLSTTVPAPTEIISGGARGPDSFADEWAAWKGISRTVLRPDWQRHGRAAGMRRNEAMLALKPDKVLAFWDGRSRGTKHMIEISRQAGVPVEVVVQT